MFLYESKCKIIRLVKLMKIVPESSDVTSAKLMLDEIIIQFDKFIICIKTT